MLPLTQRQRIRELRKKWLTLKEIRDMIKEEFGRKTLSMQTCLNVINEDSGKAVADFFNDKYTARIEAAWEKQRNKSIEEALTYKAGIDKIVEHFLAVLENKDKAPITPPKTKEITEEDEVVIAFWDLHFWRTTQDLIKNFSKLVNSIKQRTYKKLTLIILWDIYESPIVSWMHESQITEMDYLGVEQVLGAIDMLKRGIKEIKTVAKELQVIWLTGNHDRLSKKANEDPQRIVWVLGYAILKEQLKNIAEVTYYSNKVVNIEISWVNYIIHHGDNTFNQKSDMQILATYGRTDKRNIIVSWHRHSAGLTSGTNYFRCSVQSLNSPSDYELNQFISSPVPWWLEIKDLCPTFKFV